MNNEYKRFELLIEELKASGKVKLTASDFRYYSESINQELLKKLQGVGIDPSILSFYKQVDFVNIQWSVADDARLKFMDEDLDIVGGSLNIPVFSFLVEALVNKNAQSIIDPYKSLDEKDYQSLTGFLPFDLLNGNGAVCFNMKDNVVKDELYLVSTGVKSFIQPLHTNCISYLSKGHEYWFFNHWQEAFYLKNKEFKTQIEFYLQQMKWESG